MHHVIRPELKAAASAALIERGCVNVIGLDAIKTGAGSRWERMRDTIHARMEAILRQKLGPADFFAPLDDVSYIVTMPGSDSDDSQICCLRVAFELHESLLGKCTFDELKIFRAQPSADGNTLQLAELRPPQLVHLVKRAGIALTDAPGANAAPKLSAEPDTASGVPHHSHSYTPVWDAQKEAITIYRCATMRPSGLAFMPPALAVAQTVSSIQHAAALLASRLDSGNRFLIDIPISYEILSWPMGRMEIGAACRLLNSYLRPYLLFEIVDIPLGVPNSRLNDLVCTVRPFCRSVLADVSANIRNLTAFEGLSLQGFGYIAPTHLLSMSKMRDEIDVFVRATKRHSLLGLLHGVSVPEIASYARRAGVQFIEGSVVGTALTNPPPISRLTEADLLRAAAQRLTG